MGENLNALTAALMEGARLGLPPDMQEVLVHGNASRGIPAGILRKMLAAAMKYQSPENGTTLPSQIEEAEGR